MDRGSEEPISLTPEQQAFIDREVEAGRFGSAKEVVDEALRRMQDMEDFLTTNKEEIARMIEEGAASAARGELMDGEEFFAELKRMDREDDERNKRRPGAA